MYFTKILIQSQSSITADPLLCCERVFLLCLGNNFKVCQFSDYSRLTKDKTFYYKINIKNQKTTYRQHYRYEANIFGLTKV